MAQGTDMHEEKVYKNFICLRRLLELRNFTRNCFTQKWHLFIEKEQPPALPPKKVYSVKILYRQKENKRTTVIKIGERKNREDICGCISMLHTQIFLTDLCTFNQCKLGIEHTETATRISSNKKFHIQQAGICTNHNKISECDLDAQGKTQP